MRIHKKFFAELTQKPYTLIFVHLNFRAWFADSSSFQLDCLTLLTCFCALTRGSLPHVYDCISLILFNMLISQYRILYIALELANMPSMTTLSRGLVTVTCSRVRVCKRWFEAIRNTGATSYIAWVLFSSCFRYSISDSSLICHSISIDCSFLWLLMVFVSWCVCVVECGMVHFCPRTFSSSKMILNIIHNLYGWIYLVESSKCGLSLIVLSGLLIRTFFNCTINNVKHLPME